MTDYAFGPIPTGKPASIWRYEPLKIGVPLEGVLRTELLGVYTHWAGATRPCRTGHCGYCNTGVTRRWVAYGLLWQRGGGGRLFILPETTCRKLPAPLEAGDYVRITLFKAKTAPQLELLRPTSGPLVCGPVDLVEVLENLWKRDGGPTGPPHAGGLLPA